MRLSLHITLAAGIFLVLAHLASAQEKAGGPDATPKPVAMATAAPAWQVSGSTALPAFSSGHETDGMLRVVGSLFLIVVLLGGGFYFLKSGGLAMLQRGNKGSRKLNISEMRMLGNRQFLVVAEYEDKKMLIGVCPGRIDYLCPLSSGDETFSTVLPEKQP